MQIRIFELPASDDLEVIENAINEELNKLKEYYIHDVRIYPIYPHINTCEILYVESGRQRRS